MVEAKQICSRCQTTKLDDHQYAPKKNVDVVQLNSKLPTRKSFRSWIPYSMLGGASFAACNLAQSELSN